MNLMPPPSGMHGAVFQRPEPVYPPRKARGPLVRFMLNHPNIVIGSVLLTILVGIAIFAPLLTPVDPTAIAPSKRNRAPNAEYWFGTDQIGRDLYSRVLYGTRISLIVGFSVAIVASLIGLAIGLFSGFSRFADAIVMRIMDGLMSIPPILLAIAMMAFSGASVKNVIIAIAVAEVPRVARLVRGVVLTLARTALRRCRDRVRHAHADDHLAPHPAQHDGADDRSGDLHLRLSHDRRSDPVVHRGWHAADDSRRGGTSWPKGRAVWEVKPYIVLIPADVPLGDRARRQPARRRFARRSRSTRREGTLNADAAPRSRKPPHPFSHTVRHRARR